MGTAVENEFKFTTDDISIKDSSIKALEEYLVENDIVFSMKNKQSIDSYFDTDSFRLYSEGCTMRRKVSSNGKIKLTAKKPISNEFGMMSRKETERTSDGSLEDLWDFIKKEYPEITIEEEPVFLLENERISYDLDDGTNLSFDHCIYVSGEDRKGFLEIELECMSDSVERDFDSSGLCDFALELGFEQTTKSKYERGVEWLRSL